MGVMPSFNSVIATVDDDDDKDDPVAELLSFEL